MLKASGDSYVEKGNCQHAIRKIKIASGMILKIPGVDDKKNVILIGLEF